jgi:hypothetical protein
MVYSRLSSGTAIFAVRQTGRPSGKRKKYGLWEIARRIGRPGQDDPNIAGRGSFSQTISTFCGGLTIWTF